jgi:putative copper export protein
VLTIDLETVVLTLHVLAATVWVGGQIVLLALVGPLRRTAPGGIATASRAFAWVAWPAFGILVLTGGSMLSGAAGQTDPWRTTLLVKMAFAVLSGIGVALHTALKKPALKGISAGVGLVSALAVVLLGVSLVEA